MIGSIFRAAPTLVITWIMIQVAVPAARSRVNRSGDSLARRSIEKTRTAKRARTVKVPTRPSSSPMTGKMKSVWAAGRLPHFSREPPMPVPNQPPVPSA